MRALLRGGGIFAVGLWLVALVGCGPPVEDVSRHPRYNFSGMVGTTWRLKTPMAVQQFSYGYRCDIVTEEVARDFAAGRADPREFRGGSVEILPTGTLVRVESLRKFNRTSGVIDVLISFPSGKYRGMEVMAPFDFFLSNEFIYYDASRSRSSKWEINPAVLEKP